MNKKGTTKNLVLMALFAALTAVLAQIMLPLGPVLFNLAVLGAFLAGMLLPPSAAAGSMLVYFLMALVALPVLAGFTGGPGVLFGSTGGYVVGYLCIALATAWGARRGLRQTVLGMAVGLALCYALGTAWFMAVTGGGLAESLGWCVLPFLLPDAVKGAGALMLGRVLNDRLAKAGVR